MDEADAPEEAVAPEPIKPPPPPLTVAEVEKIIADAVTLSVGEAPFQHSEVKRWTDGVLETCLLQLAAMKRPNKYVATVNVSQKAGSGMHVTSATVWDAERDGKASVHWTNATVLVLAAVYWVAI